MKINIKGCGKIWNETTKGFIPTIIHFCGNGKAPDKLCPKCEAKLKGELK